MSLYTYRTPARKVTYLIFSLIFCYVILENFAAVKFRLESCIESGNNGYIYSENHDLNKTRADHSAILTSFKFTPKTRSGFDLILRLLRYDYVGVKIWHCGFTDLDPFESL